MINEVKAVALGAVVVGLAVVQLDMFREIGALRVEVARNRIELALAAPAPDQPSEPADPDQ